MQKQLYQSGITLYFREFHQHMYICLCVCVCNLGGVAECVCVWECVCVSVSMLGCMYFQEEMAQEVTSPGSRKCQCVCVSVCVCVLSNGVIALCFTYSSSKSVSLLEDLSLSNMEATALSQRPSRKPPDTHTHTHTYNHTHALFVLHALCHKTLSSVPSRSEEHTSELQSR